MAVCVFSSTTSRQSFVARAASASSSGSPLDRRRDRRAHRLDALEPRDGFALASEGLSGFLERAVERLFEIGDGRAEETFETRALAGDGLDEYVTHVAQDVIMAEGEGSATPAARQGVPRAGDARGGARGGGLLDPATEDRAGDVQAEAGGWRAIRPARQAPVGGSNDDWTSDHAHESSSDSAVSISTSAPPDADASEVPDADEAIGHAAERHAESAGGTTAARSATSECRNLE